MSKLDDMARALAVLGYARWHNINLEAEKVDRTDHFERWFATCRLRFEDDACAALAALNEPTEVMVEAGAAYFDGDSAPMHAENCWQAMIAAAGEG